ncbi:transposable element Tcb2 transposase [Trichonephila clavipes]|nr:transposable element Tcb2 transposase [Trichonephila clavipes]
MRADSVFSSGFSSHTHLERAGKPQSSQRTSLKGTEALWVFSSFSWTTMHHRHRTVAAEQLLESEDIGRHDLRISIPSSMYGDFLGRRSAARTLPPVTIRELRLAPQDEWAAMPQQLIDTLILSMGRRCETCLAVREIISPTKDRMFLAGHPSQGCFGLQSHCAPCYFSIKLLLSL